MVDARRLERGSLSARDLYLQGNSYYKMGQYEEALSDYIRSLELQPDNPTTLYNRGTTLHHLERYDDALADYDRSLKLRPDDPTTLHNRGTTLHHLERYDDALADYDRALELQPNDPTTTYNIACNFSLRGQYQESLQWLDKAIVLDSRFRAMAQSDEHFAQLKSDPEFGPKFRDLVGDETENLMQEQLSPRMPTDERFSPETPR